MARTAADCALMLNVLARPDVRDWFSLPYDGTDWTKDLALGVRGLRIAYSPRLGYVKYVHPEVEARIAEAVKILQRLGARVGAADPGFPDAEAVFTAHWTSGAWNLLRKIPPDKLALVEPELRAAAEHGGRYSLSDYFDAVAARGAMGERMKRFHTEWDLLVTPAVAVPAFEVGRLEPPSPTGQGTWTGWTPFSFPFNLTQQPAMSVPCGFTSDGLPVGLQIVGPMHRDDLVLRAGHAFEQATDHHKRRPPL
jgi:aspartyl-tRNA(Asn)/glutamyl-tRNA(Gln) amidotransferase subunit A